MNDVRCIHLVSVNIKLHTDHETTELPQLKIIHMNMIIIVSKKPLLVIGTYSPSKDIQLSFTGLDKQEILLQNLVLIFI